MSITSILLELTFCDSYLQYKAFVAQFGKLVILPSKVGFPNIGQWTYFFGVTFIHGTITFSESSGLILRVVGIKYGREFIFLIL